MNPVPAWTRAASGLRRSLTAQISIAIALVSVLMILFFGTMLDSFLARELREETEILLLSNFAFVHEDAAIRGGDLAAVRTAVQLAAHRERRLHAAVVDAATGAPLLRTPGYVLPAGLVMPRTVDDSVLPGEPRFAALEDLRRRLGDFTLIWEAPDGVRYRTVRARTQLRESGGRAAQPLDLVFAIETTPTRELRARNRTALYAALWAAAALASLLGIWIARRIVVNVRRFGATASRIGANDLGERLSLQEAPSELVETTLAFNQMLDRLQDAFERLSAFSSDLAHDLRTPIGNLLGEAQVALSRPRSAEEYRAVLESTVEECERLSRMIANMLFLARADNQPSLAAQRVHLRTALERVIGYFEVLADDLGVAPLQLHTDGAAGDATVWADETMLVRAVSNLVSNALQHAPRGSPIHVTAQVFPDGAWTIRVSNEGPAIPYEHQARIFDRFYRVDSSRSDSSAGSGLGLAIVRSVMDMHGGSVDVDSAAGRPTAFTLRFPAAAAAD